MSAQKGTRPTAATVKRAEAIESNRAAVTSRAHYNKRYPRRQVRCDVFQVCREAVTARQAAEFYGYHPNRSGFIICPFHREKTASLKFYHGGSWHCFGRNRGGSVIDFTCLLFGLDPLEAVKKLDADFHLGLPLDKPVTPQERRKAKREADRRAGITELYGTFESWRTSTINELNRCAYLGNLVEKHMGDPSELSDLAALTLRERERAEYLADTLTWGSPEEQAQLWAHREGVTRWTKRILSDY